MGKSSRKAGVSNQKKKGPGGGEWQEDGQTWARRRRGEVGKSGRPGVGGGWGREVAGRLADLG